MTGTVVVQQQVGAVIIRDIEEPQQVIIRSPGLAKVIISEVVAPASSAPVEALALRVEGIENDLQAIDKTAVGLSFVDNTSDADKPVSEPQALAITGRIAASEKGAPNGVATLDETGIVPAVQLPAFPEPLPAPVTSVAGRLGAVVLTKADVGLAVADNTSDANKPVSIAQAAALALKAPLASPSFTGSTSFAAAVVGTGDAGTAAVTNGIIRAPDRNGFSVDGGSLVLRAGRGTGTGSGAYSAVIIETPSNSIGGTSLQPLVERVRVSFAGGIALNLPVSVTSTISTSATVRATGTTASTTGVGTELGYNSAINEGYVQAYDRSAGALRALRLNGQISFDPGAGVVARVTTDGFASNSISAVNRTVNDFSLSGIDLTINAGVGTGTGNTSGAVSAIIFRTPDPTSTSGFALQPLIERARIGRDGLTVTASVKAGTFVKPGSFTAATKPSAALAGDGAIIQITDATGGSVLAQAQGGAWYIIARGTTT